MFKVRVTKPFRDMTINNVRRVGDEFEVESEKRVRELLKAGPNQSGVIKILKASKRLNKEYSGPKILIYQNSLYYIGGIETFLQNFTKYYQDRNITIITPRIGADMMIYLSRYCDVELDEPTKIYNCDVLLLGNHNSSEVLPKVRTNKVYQMIHADWDALKKIPQWKQYEWRPHSRVTNIISVSESAAKGLKKSMGYDSEIIYNILDTDIQSSGLKMFITLSRATSEKGIERVIKMAEEFKKADKKFVWLLCCSLEQAQEKIVAKIKTIPEFVIIKPDVCNKDLIAKCDYLVQLSDTESFCYSAFEALQRKVPVILTNFPEAKNIVQDGHNGYLVNMDLSNLDVEKIFNHKPNRVFYDDKCDYEKWEKVFKGEL